MTTVAVNTYTHSVTYLADNILFSLKNIIRDSGLNPANFVSNWGSNKRAIMTWLESEALTRVILEIYNPITNSLVTRWDIDVVYGWTGSGEFWTDAEQLEYALRKAGVVPSSAKYDFILTVEPGTPDITGWTDVTVRSTSGMVRQSLGSTIEHNGLAANSAYWRHL